MFRKIVFMGSCLALLAGRANASVTFISSCPFVISEPGKYHLSADITCSSPASGITILSSANGTELHFNGHTLTGDRRDAGVLIFASDVTIQGSGTIAAFGTGIYFNPNTSGGRIVGMTTTDNIYGILLLGSTNNTLISNIVTGNATNGIAVEVSSKNNIIRANVIDSNGVHGVFVGFESTRNLFQANEAHNNAVFDLKDFDSPCSANTWKSNRFGTADGQCID